MAILRFDSALQWNWFGKVRGARGQAGRGWGKSRARKGAPLHEVRDRPLSIIIIASVCGQGIAFFKNERNWLCATYVCTQLHAAMADMVLCILLVLYVALAVSKRNI